MTQSTKEELLGLSPEKQIAVLKLTLQQAERDYLNPRVRGKLKQGLKMLIDGLRRDIWLLELGKVPKLNYLT